jgi:hypothetical protein
MEKIPLLESMLSQASPMRFLGSLALVLVIAAGCLLGAAALNSLHQISESYCLTQIAPTEGGTISRPRSLWPPGIVCQMESGSLIDRRQPSGLGLLIAAGFLGLLAIWALRGRQHHPRVLVMIMAATVGGLSVGAGVLVGLPVPGLIVVGVLAGVLIVATALRVAQRYASQELASEGVLLAVNVVATFGVTLAAVAGVGPVLSWLLPITLTVAAATAILRMRSVPIPA